MIWKYFIEQVADRGDHDAVIFNDQRLSYNQLASLAASIATTLPTVKVKPSRVLIRQKSPVDILISVLACWCRGLVPVVLRESMTDAQVSEIAIWLNPEALLDQLTPEVTLNYTFTNYAPQLDFRDEGLVICTSGTTGQPKLVALPVESVIITANAIKKALALNSTDRVAVNTPLGYMYGLMGGCVAGLLAGATCYLFSPHEPLTQLQAGIRRNKITVVQGPPSLFRMFFAYWNKTPFPEVRIVTTGGEPLGEDLSCDFNSAFPYAQKLFLYGMTEAGPRISDLGINEGGGVDSCIGVPYPHFDWRLDPVPGSDAGRLVLRGPSLLLGYINPSGNYDGLDAEGYFHSNDLLSIDQDGKLHFRGRMDRIFRSGGKLVNPEAIERILASHPDVLDAVCYSENHSLLGLIPVADVVLKPEKPFNLSSLKELCRKHVEAHAIPRRIVAIETSDELAESGKRLRPTDSKRPSSIN